MDKQEFAFRTLGKFLAISATAKAYKDRYQKDIPKDYVERLMNDLQKVASEYFNSIYKIESDKFIGFCAHEYYEGDDYSPETYIPYFDIEDSSNDVGC